MKEVWDRQVNASSTPHFLFWRDYMEYHRDRFLDHSLFIFRNDKLVAIFPANQKEASIFSHSGLSFGGLIVQPGVRFLSLQESLRAVLHYYVERGISRVLYKAAPHYYSTEGSENLEGAVWYLGGALIRRASSFVINRREWSGLSRRKKRSCRISQRFNLQIHSYDKDWGRFWDEILIPCLKTRHGSNPVHTGEEIERLSRDFPNEIQLHTVRNSNGALIAGTVIYLSPQVAHAQYLAANEEGRECHALDFLFRHLVGSVFFKIPFFSFGTCNGGEGGALQKSIAEWKEGFGAKAFSHDIYEFKMN